MVFLFQRGQPLQDRLQTLKGKNCLGVPIAVRRTKYYTVLAQDYIKVQVKALQVLQWSTQSKKSGAFFSQLNLVGFPLV